MDYLKELDSSIYLQRITSVETSDSFRRRSDPANTQPHFEACYNFRSRITNLKVDNNYVLFSFNGITGNSLVFLPHFKHLTRLSFTGGSRDTTLTSVEIQKSFPNLIAIEFENCFLESDASIIRELRALAEYNQITTIKTPLYYMQNIQEFSLKVSSLTIHYLRYLLQHLPPKMKALHIGLEKTEVYDWIDQVGSTNVLDLLKRQSQIPNASIANFIGSQYQPQHRYDETTKFTQFFKLLETLKGSHRNLYSTASFIDQFHICSLEVSNNCNINSIYGFDPERYQSLPFSNHDSNNTATASDQPFNSFRLINRALFKFFRVTEQNPAGIIRFVLKNCPCLQSLCIKSVIKPTYTIHFSCMDAKDGPITKHAVTKSADRSKFILVQGCLDIKPIINTLHGINGLEIIVCKSEQESSKEDCYRQLSSSNNRCLHLDLRPFRSLGLFYINTSYIPVIDQEYEPLFSPVVVQFKYANGESNAYLVEFSDPNSSDSEEKSKSIPLDLDTVDQQMQTHRCIIIESDKPVPGFVLSGDEDGPSSAIFESGVARGDIPDFSEYIRRLETKI